jgi:hypothetical protein
MLGLSSAALATSPIGTWPSGLCYKRGEARCWYTGPPLTTIEGLTRFMADDENIPAGTARR